MNIKSKPLIPLTLIVGLVLAGGVYSYLRAPLESQAAWGRSEPQYELAKCYFHGVGVNQNYHEAARWFRLAAHQGHAKALTALGMMYAQGEGLSQDYQAAVQLFRQASDQGLDAAQNQLGMLYAQGRGVDQNLDEATRLFRLAAAQGYAAARQNLKLIGVARPGYFEQVTTRNGNSYRNVQVQKVEWDGITVQFNPASGGMGVAKLAFKELPTELQQQYEFVSEPQFAQARNSLQLAAVVLRPL